MKALPAGGLSKACCLKSLAINPSLPVRNDETDLEVGTTSAAQKCLPTCTLIAARAACLPQSVSEQDSGGYSIL